jgi:small subunit ribosomal protein S8
MTMNDTLSASLSKVLNAERIGKKECTIAQGSKIIKKVLKIMKDNLYVGDVHESLDGRGNQLSINLIGNINKCGAIKPRFSTQVGTYEKWEKRYLPAKGFGILIISTPKGVMTHEEAKEQQMGGKLLAYCY